MIIPSKMKIGGFTYKIIKNCKFPTKENLMAEIVHARLEIRLSNAHRLEEVKYTPERMEEAFIHELIHGIDHVYNGSKLEEETVGRLSQGLYQVLVDNNLQGGK